MGRLARVCLGSSSRRDGRGEDVRGVAVASIESVDNDLSTASASPDAHRESSCYWEAYRGRL